MPQAIDLEKEEKAAEAMDKSSNAHAVSLLKEYSEFMLKCFEPELSGDVLIDAVKKDAKHPINAASIASMVKLTDFLVGSFNFVL